MATRAKKRPKKKKGKVAMVKTPAGSPKGASVADLNDPVEQFVEERPLPSFNIAALGFKACITDTVKLLLTTNEPPRMFSQSGVLSDVKEGAIRTIEGNRLMEMLSKLCVWRTADGNEAVPNERVINIARESDELIDELPVLESITTAPVFSADGRFETAPGYHESTKSYYRPAPGFVVPDVPDTPTDEQVERAKNLIWSEVLGDFPFTGQAEKAHAVAMLITAFTRALLKGADAPMFLFDAPTAGTGKGLSLNALATIVTGGRMKMAPEGGDDNEWRKRILAIMLEGAPIICFDNMKRRVESPALALLLTGGGIKDRVLGHSKMVWAPTRSVLCGTGNNVEASKELNRRFAWIRLADPKGDPLRADRSFEHPDLIEWVRENRGELVWAVAVMVRRWFALECPEPKLVRGRPSYEQWTKVIGGIMESVGIEGVNGNYDERVNDATDPQESAWVLFVSKWANVYGERNVKVQDLWMKVYDRTSGLIDARGDDVEKHVLSLGKAVRGAKDKRYGDWFVRRAPVSSQGVAWWYLESAKDGAA